jgi:hypothetical protein
MFRLFQIDPETSAIHINTGALMRHRHASVFVACLDAFRQNKLDELWKTLWRFPDSEERAFAVLFLDHLLHEVRHFIDLILTPYGFYRLRAGLEFYRTAHVLLARKSEKLILPLSSGLDSFFQEVLDAGDYTETFSYIISKIARSRAEVLAAENKQHQHESGLFVELGGDAILESLAFGYQMELLAHGRFRTPWIRRLMPYAFDSFERANDDVDLKLNTGLTQFKLRYLWHYPLLKTFAQEATPQAGKLLYCILFAALCGSFAKDAKYHGMEFKNVMKDPADKRWFSSGGRYIDEKLPSHRLKELLAWAGNYVERGGAIPHKWEEIFALVNRANQSIWGNTIIEEIELDIASDELLIERVKQSDGSYSVESHPFRCFVDLVAIRRSLISLLKNDSGAILNPLRLCHTTDTHLTIPIYHLFPAGDIEPIPGASPIIEEVFRVPDKIIQGATQQRAKLSSVEPGKVLVEKVCFSAWELKIPKDTSVEARFEGREAWPTVLGFFGPFYKLALYGLRYRTMLEYDLVKMKQYLDVSLPLVAWDDYYLSVNDVSSPMEYFHFYDIKEADCDICSKRITAVGGAIVSSGTLRNSPEFVQNQRRRLGDLAEYSTLGKDWSVWLVCHECCGKYLGGEVNA